MDIVHHAGGKLTGHLGVKRSRAGSGEPSFEGSSREKSVPMVNEKHLLLRTRSEADVKCSSLSPVGDPSQPKSCMIRYYSRLGRVLKPASGRS